MWRKIGSWKQKEYLLNELIRKKDYIMEVKRKWWGKNLEERVKRTENLSRWWSWSSWNWRTKILLAGRHFIISYLILSKRNYFELLPRHKHSVYSADPEQLNKWIGKAVDLSRMAKRLIDVIYCGNGLDRNLKWINI